MVIRQQMSDLISYGKLVTTKTKAKETQRHIERLITAAKEKSMVNTVKFDSLLLDTKNDTKEKLITKLYSLGQKYKDRKGGYTRVLKLDTRPGDRTQEAIIAFV
jgi:large subunit ribosomal protein L17